MATTSPDGLVSPNNGEEYNLITDWADSMSSVQSALNNRASRSGTTNDRLNASNPRTGLIWYDTTDSAVYRYTGTGWQAITGDDTGWNTITSFANGFSAISGAPVRVRRIGSTVYLRGELARSTAPSGGVTAFTLPAEFRLPPGAGSLFYWTTPFDSQDNPATVQILESGNVRIECDQPRTTAPGYSLHGATFLVD